MNKTKKELRDEIEQKLMADPELKPIVLAAIQKREQLKEKQSDRQFFEGMFKMMSQALDRISGHVDSGEKQAEALSKAADTVMTISKTLAGLIDQSSTENELKMIEELEGMRAQLAEIKEVAGTPSVVNVEAPIVEVPEPKVIQNTKIIQETEHTQKAVEILSKILEKLANQKEPNLNIPSSFLVKNIDPKQAIPVTLTDKNQKVFQDLSEIARNMLIAANNAPSQVSLKTVTGSLGTAGNPMRVDPTGTTTQPVDTELPAAAAMSDAMSNPTAPAVASMSSVWDSVSGQWKRSPGDSTNGTDVDVTRITQGIRAEVTGSANGNGQTPIAATDVSNYRWVSVWLNGGFLTCTFEGSNNNSNWSTVALMSTGSTNSAGAINAANPNNAIFHGPINFKYFRVRVSAYTSGTVSAIAEFFMSPSGIQSIGATVLPGNTVNTSPWYVRQQLGTSSDTYTVTGSGTAINLSTASIPVKAFAVQVKGTGGAATLWNVSLEGSLDGTNYQELINHATADGDGVVKWTSDKPILHLRSRCSALTLGGATNIVVTILGMP